MKEQKYLYNGPRFGQVGINPVLYQSGFFEMEIELESDIFYEIRKSNNIIPFKLTDGTNVELEKVKLFFNDFKSSFFFLFNGKELIGSILIMKNYIQTLSIAKTYQRQGYGEKLAKYAINYIYDHNYDSVFLHVIDGNIAAQKLYEKIGFKRVEEKKI